MSRKQETGLRDTDWWKALVAGTVFRCPSPTGSCGVRQEGTARDAPPLRERQANGLWCLSVDDCTDRVLLLLATRSARETLGLSCEIKIRGPSLSRLHSGWYCDSPASAGSRCALTTQTGEGVVGVSNKKRL